jgi:hypothetical protein
MYLSLDNLSKNISTIKNTVALLDDTKDVGLKGISGKTEYMLVSY